MSRTPAVQSPLDAAPKRSRAPFVLGGAGATVVHALLLAGAVAASSMPPRAAPERRAQVTRTELIHIEPPPPPPEPPPATPEPPPPTPEPAPSPPSPSPRPRPKVAKPPKEKPAENLEQAAPAAAEAAKVLEKAPEPEVVDFGETFVQGSSETYAGGVTEAGGTSKNAVRDQNARAFGVEGGKGTAEVDLSRPPMLAGGKQWDCPFPEEADAEGVDEAVVTIKVSISASGEVDRVDVIKDPGLGFGRETRRCAMRKRWQPALSRTGSAVAQSHQLTVRFER